MTKEEIEDIIYGLYDAKSDIERNDRHARRTREDIDKAIKAIEALQALQGKSINCNYTCSDCVHQDKAYEEEPCLSCFNNDGAGYEPVGYEPVKFGKWEEKETHLNEGDCEITEWQSARCSKCGKYHTTPYMYSFNNFNFCPSCGARMDKE